MSDRPLTRCAACRRLIDPGEEDVVEAVAIRPIPGFGTGFATANGPGYAFHETCFPAGDPNWRRR